MTSQSGGLEAHCRGEQEVVGGVQGEESGEGRQAKGWQGDGYQCWIGFPAVVRERNPSPKFTTFGRPSEPFPGRSRRVRQPPTRIIRL